MSNLELSQSDLLLLLSALGRECRDAHRMSDTCMARRSSNSTPSENAEQARYAAHYQDRATAAKSLAQRIQAHRDATVLRAPESEAETL
jgi:hypothetical protein